MAKARETLADAPFRIGQLLAEEVGSRETMTFALTEAAMSHGSGATPHVKNIIDKSLAAGMAAKGIAHYRLHRSDYLFRYEAVE